VINIYDAQTVTEWQHRLAAQPKVYVVREGRPPFGEETGNLYATREAAQLEVDWLLANVAKSAYVASLGTLHSLKLSKERWT
jgi:hypothetical protein